MAIIGQDILKAKQFLEQGETVGIPTETVYGLAANALNQDAVLKIFEVKNRPTFDPLIVHVANIEQIGLYAKHIPSKVYDLLERFSPGPLTILLPKKRIIHDLVTSGLEKVAIRIPNHPLTLSLLQTLPFPLAAPSANPFGYISPTNAQHVFEQLGEKIPYILDGGDCTIGVESTIIGFENKECIVYRLGGLEIEEIEAVLGTVKMQLNQSSNPKSPGMLKSHYAPRKPLFHLDIPQIVTLTANLDKIGLITFKESEFYKFAKHHIALSPKGDLNEAAKKLFAAMRHFDKNKEIEYIVAEKFPPIGLGRAINDRLERAASKD